MLDEILDRIPDWEVDAERAELDSAVVRGWRSLPVHITNRAQPEASPNGAPFGM